MSEQLIREVRRGVPLPLLDEPKASLLAEVQRFLLDRQGRGVAPATQEYYTWQLTGLCRWLDEQGITTLDGLSPDILTRWKAAKLSTCKPRGAASSWRAVSVFLHWLSAQTDNPAYLALVVKVGGIRVPRQPLPGASPHDILSLLNACGTNATGRRNRALILLLADSGLRVSEALALDWGDLALREEPARLVVRHGKGDKFRTAGIGPTVVKVLRDLQRRYPNLAPSAPVFTNVRGERLGYGALRAALRRLAVVAGINHCPTPHDFRRAWALGCLRNGMDVYSLQHLGGWADLETPKSYLALTVDDALRAHALASPVERMLRGR